MTNVNYCPSKNTLEYEFNEDGYTIGGKSVGLETAAQRNERLAIVREAQRKERYNAALCDATIPEADKEYEELTREERYELGAAEEVLRMYRHGC